MGQQHRSWKADDFLALFSWIFFGNTVFVLLSTTTFFSVLLFLSNSLQFQELIAKLISDYLTKETGFNISFESAIVPQWRQGVIRFGNVVIKCNNKTWIELLRKRHQLLYPNTPFNQDGIDTNWSYWDVTVENIDVTLSLWRWLEGKGILTECQLKGVRGTIDRRHIIWPEDWVPVRRKPQQGDFNLDNFVVDDLLLTILNPGFRPYTISVFNGKVPKLRKQWLMYDLICADSIVGMFDQCLFSVHRPHQSIMDPRWSKTVILYIY
jgi:distribution and morphology protein 31